MQSPRNAGAEKLVRSIVEPVQSKRVDWYPEIAVTATAGVYAVVV